MGGGQSLFDSITNDDLIVAFFPCIEFSCVAQMWFSLGQRDYKKWDLRRIFQYMLNKSNERTKMFNLLYKFCFVVLERGLRMVFENPWGLNTYLKQNVFLKEPDVVDNDRSMRGDFRIKPTGYWFWNCEPTNGFTMQPYQGKIYNHNDIHDERHHPLSYCHDDINLIDIIEMVVDCTVAGLARSGEVKPIEVNAEILNKAVSNTTKLIQRMVVVTDKQPNLIRR